MPWERDGTLLRGGHLEIDLRLDEHGENWVTVKGDKDSVVEANARLIAAAPFAPHQCEHADCPGLHLFALLKTIAEDHKLGGIYRAQARAILEKLGTVQP